MAGVKVQVAFAEERVTLVHFEGRATDFPASVREKVTVPVAPAVTVAVAVSALPTFAGVVVVTVVVVVALVTAKLVVPEEDFAFALPAYAAATE